MKILNCAIIAACFFTSVIQGSKPYAIVTMISSTDCIEMANILQFSIKKNSKRSFRQKVEFIALLIKEHSDNHLITENLVGWKARYVNRIDPGIPGAVTFPRFKEQFTKLHIFNMTEYKRILYFDSDVLVVGDISPLLVKVQTSFAAVRDWEWGKIRNHVNCGVLSVSPNSTEFQPAVGFASFTENRL
jgi:alpha-N-acetylglucosamine transferase